MEFDRFKELVKRSLPEFATDKLRYLKTFLFSRSQIIGMTSKSEQEFYRKCARDLSNQDGTIVDLGCWMGSTSIWLAKGVRENKRQNVGRIYAFDRFVWEDWMNPYRAIVKRRYNKGDSFLAEVQWRIRRYSEVIELIKADLRDYEWNDGPISILLVDAMKNRELTKSIASSFFPLITKDGILIHQDFKHFYTPWIHILQFRLRKYFAFLEDVPHGSTVAFKCIRQMPKHDLMTAVDFEDITTQEISDVFSYSMGLVNDDQKSAIAAAHIMFFVHGNLKSEADNLLEEYSAAGLQESNDFRLAEKAVKDLT